MNNDNSKIISFILSFLFYCGLFLYASYEQIAAFIIITISIIAVYYFKIHLCSFIDDCIETGLYLLVFIVPLFFSKYTKQNFLLSKECFISFMVLILLSFWLIKIVLNKNNRIIRSSFTFPIIVFYFINFLSVFKAHNKIISAYAFYLLFNYAALFFIMLYNIRSLKQIKIMLTMFCLTAGFVSFYGICQFFNIDPLFSAGEVKGNTGRSKVFSTFGNPTFLADYLVVVLPITIGYYIDKYKPRNVIDFLRSIAFVAAIYFMLFLYAQGYGALSVVLSIAFISGVLIYLFRGKKNKDSYAVLDKLYGLIGAFSFVSIFVCIVITRTRGAWLGVFFSFLFTMFILMIVERKKMIFLLKYSFVLLFLMIFFLSILYYMPATHNDMKRIVSMMKHRFTSSSTITQRFLMWRVGWEMFKDSNFMGHGVGNFKVVYSDYQKKFLSRPDIDVEYKREAVCFRHAHNEYVHMLTEIGFLGLAAFFFIFFVFFRESYKLLKKKDDFFIDMGIIAGVSAVLIQSVFNFPFHRATPTLTVFSLMAFVALKGKYKENKDEMIYDENDMICLPCFFTSRYFKIPFFIISLIIIRFVFFPKVAGYFEGSKDLKSGYMLITSPSPANEREQRLQKAIELLKRSLENDPSDREGETHYWTGIAYEELGDYSSALEWYMKALKYTQNKLVYFHIGLIHMRNRNFSEAKKYLYDTVGIVPKFVDGYFNLALIYLQENDHVNAIREFKNVIFYKKDYAATYQYLGEIYYKNQDHLNAAYYYGIFSDNIENNENILNNEKEKEKFLNLQKLISFSYKEVIAEFSKKTAKTEKNISCEDQINSNETSVKSMWEKEKIKIKAADPCIDKINLEYSGFSDIKNIIAEKKISFLEQSYKKFPQLEVKYSHEIEKIFDLLVFQVKVLDELDIILESDNNTEIIAAGYYFLMKKRYDKACAAFGRSIRYMENNNNNENSKEYELQNKLLVECAENALFSRLKRISEMLPYDIDLHYNLGMDFFNKNRFDEAVHEWSQILKYRSIHVKALFYRGLAYSKLEQYKRAVDDWQKIVSIAAETEEGILAKQHIEAVKHLIKN